MLLPEEEHNTLPPTPPKRNTLAKVVLWGFGILLALLLTPILLLFIYQKEIKEQIVQELNKHLKTKVFIQPEDIDLTIIRTFPKAALWLKNVTVMGSLPDTENDTLLKAERIYLLFNAQDIWNKKYEINQIEITNAALSIKTNTLGEGNYEFWQTAVSAAPAQQNTHFKLKKIALDNFTVSYKNDQNKFHGTTYFKTLTLSGDFSETTYNMNFSGSGLVQNIAIENKKYLTNKHLQIEAVIDIKNNAYTLQKTEIKLNKLVFSASGTIENTTEGLPCALSCKGQNIDIQALLSLLPEKFHDKIKEYESQGLFYAEAHLKGDLSDYYALGINSSFGIKNASISYKPLNTKLSNVNINGLFTKGIHQPEYLSLKNIEAQQNQNYVQGNMELKNFSYPHLTFNAKGAYHLQDLFALMPIDTLSAAKGQLNFDVQAAIQLNELSTKRNDAIKVQGQIQVSDMELVFKNKKTIQVPQGTIKWQDDDLLTENLQLIHGNSSLQINGKATNLFNYLFKEQQKMEVEAHIASPMIDMNDFIFPVSANTSGTNKKIISLNPYITADIHFSFDKIVFHAFEGKNISGKLQVKNRKIIADDLKLDAFGGHITLRALADNSDTTRVHVNCSTNLEQVDIKKMFYELNNFGQQAISDKNIKGTASLQTDFAATWNNLLECDLSSILASADVNINKGELIDYKPLQSLSKHIELKELQQIKFATLNTHVEIKNKTITLSKTQVGNSALNLDIWGTHNFNNEVDYHIKLLLSDYLAKRPGKAKQLDEELMENETDPELKRTVFLHLYGPAENPTIKYDKKAMKQKIRQDIKEEKQNLKRLLKEEFGWFKKDTSLNKKEDAQKFKVDFNSGKPQPKNAKKEKEDEEDF
ncbi:MAG: hypothetical protein JST67_04995 [Bacteroidetes bacterium]|nr:hypothetical protein [Bacteroidota bacterium]